MVWQNTAPGLREIRQAVGERKQGSSKAAKRSKPVPRRSVGRKASSKRAVSGVPKDLASDAGKKEPRRAPPKIGVKKEKNPAKKPGPGSETPPMVKEKSKIMAEPSENQAERGTAGGTEAAPSANQAAAKPETSVPQTRVSEDKRGKP